jgi:outer membrane protein
MRIAWATANACIWMVFIGGATAYSAELKLSDAVAIALQKNADVKVQAEILTQGIAQIQQAQGPFDIVLSAGTDQERTITPLPGGFAGSRHQTRSDTSYHSVALSKLFTNGVRAGISLDATSVKDTGLDGIALRPQNAVTLGASLNIPLLKGGGTEVTRLTLDLAGINGEASRHALRDTVSAVIFATVSAYWDYLAQAQLLTLAQEAEQRSKQLLESTRQLVKANERPRADLVLLEADYADKSAASLLAAQQLVNARRQLARVLGADAADADALPLPADRFPAAGAEAEQIQSFADRINALALQGRPDLLVLRTQLEGARRQVRVAEKSLKPQLDLVIGSAYGKASEGGTRLSFPGLGGTTQSEPSVYAKLVFQFPLQNNLASGSLSERTSILRQAEVRLEDTEAGIRIAVNNALLALSVSEQHLRLARRSLTLYDEAVQNEIVKRRNGIATLIDVITVQDRFNGAQQNLIQLQAEYAKAVARLQRETATTLPIDSPSATGNRLQIDTAELASLGRLRQQLGIPAASQKEAQ